MLPIASSALEVILLASPQGSFLSGVAPEIIDINIPVVNYSVTKLPEHLNQGGIPPFFRMHPWHHYCLLFRAIQLLLLFPVFSVRLRTVLFLLRIRSDIFSGYYMRLRHLRYRFCFPLCTTLSLSVWTALHIFSLLPVTADCTGWYNFLPKVTRMRRAIIQNQKHYLQIIQIPTHPITSAQKRNAFPARPLPDFVSPSKNLLSFLQKSV